MTDGRCAVPPGYVLIRLDDLTALAASRQEPAADPPAEPAQALAAVVGLLTGELTDARLRQADLIDSADASRIVRLLVVMSAGLMRGTLPEDGAGLLRALGAAAVMARDAG